MRPFLCLFATALLSLSALAQHPASDELRALTRQVYNAVDAQKWEEAITLMKRLDALQPETLGNAYNLACMYSRKGDLEEGLAWLDKSVQWGWGGGRGGIYAGQSTSVERITQIEMLAKDTDLELLRKDPRFGKLSERAQATGKRAEEYATTPATYVPEKLKDAAELPVLLVLHDYGGEKNATLAAWKGLADELGCALAVPAAPYPAREDPSRGWGWIDDQANFELPQRTAEYQRAIVLALDALRKTRKLSAGKLWIAGEGQGGMLALVTGLHNASLYKGLAVLDPDVVPALCGYKVPTAKTNGLRLEARFDPLPWKARAVECPTKMVQGWALPGSAVETAELKDAAAKQGALADAVRALVKASDAAATPAPAVAPK